MNQKRDQKKVWQWPDKKGAIPLLGPDGPFKEMPSPLSERVVDERSEVVPPTSRAVGSLSIFVMRNPDTGIFFEGLPNTDYYLDLNLEADEWAALFYDVLDCPKAIDEISSNEESKAEWRKRYILKFQQAIPNFPMLSRMWDLYIYISYNSEEIEQLRNEALKVQASTSNEKALAGLAKLLGACDEASKLGSGLLFVPD